MFAYLYAAFDFASLGLTPTVHLFGIDLLLRWYSLAYIAGILGGWWYLGRMIDSGGAPLTRVQADAFVTWATVGIILGGRTGYVLFYDLPRFTADPVAIFKLWEGGMSFHGGMLGLAAAGLWFARINRLNGLRMCDYVTCVGPIGQCLGRLANFNNGELWGRVTGSDYGIVFPGAGPLPRHPSQLYEAAFEGLFLLLLLGLLFWRTPARRYPGLLFGTGLAVFGALRFGIEFFREPDVQVGYLTFGLTMGQWLCVPMVVAGIALTATAPARAVRLAAA